MKRTIVLATVAAIALPLGAQSQDAPPVDIGQLLQELKKLREVNAGGIKSRRMNAYNKVRDAASSPEKAVAFWKEAVKTVQFEGAKKEGSQIRDWREGDGEALNDKLCQGAVRLHLQWLALSLEHAAGAEMKQLLPQVIEFARAVQADITAAENLSDQLEKARDSKNPAAKRDLKDDATVKRVHDTILRTPVTDGPVARWLQLKDILDEVVTKKPKNGEPTKPPTWEHTPGNWEGIYGSIILPEFRASKDPRLLEYWDTVLKRETERAADRRLDIEQREWSQEKRPRILWSRAQDVMVLGQRNRALGEMFNLIKTYPQHPEADTWIAALEGMLVTTPAVAPAPAPANGTVPAPVAVPPATGPVPVGTIVTPPPAPGARPPAR